MLPVYRKKTKRIGMSKMPSRNSISDEMRVRAAIRSCSMANGSTVWPDDAVDEEAGARHAIYKYLLLATRLNMKDDRRHAGCDGAHLFEELAAESARCYLGDRSESLVFGTAAGTAGFSGKVDDLCARLGEGGGFRNPDDVAPTERDGKLDVVAWKSFSDRRPGKLIAFGQCKTGTHYRAAFASRRRRWRIHSVYPFGCPAPSNTSSSAAWNSMLAPGSGAIGR